MKNNMVLKIIKGLMFVVALLMIVPVSARPMSRKRPTEEQNDGAGVAQRPSKKRGGSPSSRTIRGSSSQSRAQRNQQQASRLQKQERTPTEKITPEKVSSQPAPGSQQPQSDEDTWQKILDVLDGKEPSVVLEAIKKIKDERPTLTNRQKADLSRLERIAKLEIKVANLESQQSGQPAGTQTGPENKPQQQETQTAQLTPPAGGGPSVSAVRTNPFIAPQADVVEQQVKPTVTTESKPQRLGPIQQAWKEMPSAGQMIYGVFGGDPNILQTPKVVSQPAPAKQVGALKQAYRDLPSFSSVLYQLGGGQDEKITNPKPQAVQEQTLPEPISEKDWRDLLDALAAQEASQALVNDIEELKKYPGLSNTQREELERFQRDIKTRLSNPFIAKRQAPVAVGKAQTQLQQQIPVPVRSSSLASTNTFLQTPTPPRALPAQLPSNPFMTSGVVPKVQKATQQSTVANPFSIPQQQVSPVSQPQVEAISEERWQEIRAKLKQVSTTPSQAWVNKIEEIKNNPRLTQTQRDELVAFQQQMKELLAKNPFVQAPQPPAVEQKLHPLTGRPLDTKPKKPGPLQNLWPDWSAFY